jgi:hypothetical protein
MSTKQSKQLHVNRRAQRVSTGSVRGRNAPKNRRVVWLLVALLFLSPAAVRAQTKSTAMGDGLSVAVDWWSLTNAGGGYCPMHLQISNTTSRPRPLRVVIESSVMQTGQNEVAQSLELPASGKADFVISLPITSPYESGTLKVYERGRELKKLRIPGIGGTFWWTSQTVPMVAVIGNSSPDLRNMIAAVTQITTGQNTTNTGNYAPLILKPGNAPTKWIDYTTLDMVLISIRDLEQMPAAARDAMVAWTLAGGNLFIYGTSGDRENAPELNRLLDLDRRMPSGASWRRPRLEDRNAEFIGYVNQYPGQSVATVTTTKAGSSGKTDKASNSGTESQPAQSDLSFSVRPFGLGQLAVSSLADPFPGTLEDWGWVIKTFKTNRVQWQERHGVSPRFENDDFWHFLIPGVGRAPVGGFQLLIVLFAVMIGPINYFVLRRRRQLYFLIATVPAMALITTLLLLGYAIVSDGFALRGRVRSLTVLDQVRGESVSWSRVSYYAGVAPSGGLRFSTDTAVYPMRPPGASTANRTLDWTDGQNMPTGWLRSRTPTQLLTVHYRQGTEQLAIATSTTGAARVTNNLGTAVRWLAVADENDRLFFAENVAVDASERLESRELPELQAALRNMINEQPLETPAEITSRYYATGFFGSRTRFWGPRSAAQWHTGRSEEVFQALHDTRAESIEAILKPRTYIAVTDQPPTVDLGVTQMQDEGSLFIIIGSY